MRGVTVVHKITPFLLLLFTLCSVQTPAKLPVTVSDEDFNPLRTSMDSILQARLARTVSRNRDWERLILEKKDGCGLRGPYGFAGAQSRLDKPERDDVFGKPAQNRSASGGGLWVSMIKDRL